MGNVKANFEAWSAHDVERILAESDGAGGGLGFGFRTRDIRVDRTTDEERQLLTAWFDTLNRYQINDLDINCSVDGDVATVWGFFSEDFTHTGQAPESVRVRYSMVFRRLAGQWQLVWNHRDAQEFAEDGFYVRKPMQDG